MDNRPSWDEYFMDFAELTAKRSTCLRRQVGAVIVQDKHIIATGYNGAPRGRANCSALGTCMRDELGIPRGERYEMCRAIHAEQNAIIIASRDQMMGATMYVVGEDSKTGELINDICSCMMCKRAIINSGIEKVVFRTTPTKYYEVKVRDWVINDDSMSGNFGY